MNGFCCPSSGRIQCRGCIIETGKSKMEESIMRTVATIAATLSVIGAIAVGSAVPAAAWYGYHQRYHHHHYGYYDRHHYAYHPYYHHRYHHHYWHHWY